jgi:hypothetical protein
MEALWNKIHFTQAAKSARLKNFLTDAKETCSRLQ